MSDHTLHAIDGTASNVLGSGFSWAALDRSPMTKQIHRSTPWSLPTMKHV